MPQPPARQWDAWGVPDAAMAKQLGLNEALLQTLMELPGTRDMLDLKTRLVALADWNKSLRKGVLPKAATLEWPQEPFRSQFLDVLKNLEMARFTRRHPKLLPALLKQFLELVAEFEENLLEQESQQKQKQNQQQQRQSQASGQEAQQQEQQAGEGEGEGDGGGEQEPAPDDAQQQNSGEQQQSDTQGKEGQQDYDLDLENSEGQAGEQQREQASDQQGSNRTEQMVQELLEGFKQQWEPVVEALDIADQAFDDINGLLEGPEGFDSSRSVWHQTGWREVASLRKKLEDLTELRELVRQLGRGGGKGPLKKAPEQVYNSKHPPGVIRSPMQPEETRGLTRSGDLSRMLPFEAHLLAAGWPRYVDAEPSGEEGEDGSSGGGGGSSGERVVTKEGSRGARMLFQARRAERMLMSYERTGWVEDEPARLTGRMEVRPAAELGPIIVCLDTSGSMYGPREVVAKAVALECMRGAHRQQRRCYLYAFSGPGEVMELELGNDAASIRNLLTFLTSGFGGGTDVDAPLALSLERVGREEWSLADILMVTDGEIPHPSEEILSQLGAARDSLGLEVHGLLVGRSVTPPMEALCTHLHVFKSWSVSVVLLRPASSKIYVQGLPQALQHPVAVAGLFAPFGDVLDVKLYAAEVRLSGGSAVVRMRNTTQAAAAIAALNGVVPEGGWQQLTVRAAETAEQRSSRITAINGRQGTGAPGSPMAHALPPAGPGGAALRRVHSARSSGSHSALQCYTGGLASDALGGAMPMQRRSLDWPHGSTVSMDSSRRSSIDVARCSSAGGPGMMHAGRRSSSDSGSGSGSEEQLGMGGGSATGSLPAEGPAGGAPLLSNSELQRMLLEAVLALLAQVETGQLSLPAMRSALEAALVAAKQATGEEASQPEARGRQLPSLRA
ncbi:von Willebrand type A [Micractinium conductrix]|uniref:von Willebrand type A n=1 Tax=Micractinium conductrix TaxID=554055 RepID=A0A2P6V6W7_9CHLO|nr:von Willebrand type A [Micractinium conductrix]|eukprot:PSC69825.1 von Willebrand type A [Micractinium conductrix]